MAGDCEIEGVIQNLLALLDGNSLDSEKQCKHLVETVNKYFKTVHNQSELDLGFSLLFKPEISLLYFIEKGVRNRSIKAGIKDSLSLVLFVFDKYSNNLANYVGTIKDACYKCVQECNVPADIKEKAYDVIISIIKSKVALQASAQLRIDALASFIHKRELVSIRTLSPTVVLKVYELYGAIAEQFPFYCQCTVSAVLRNIRCELRKQMTGTGDVKFPIITGCMLALKGILVNFDQDWKNDAGMAMEIYGYIKNACVFNDTFARRVFQRAALEVFRSHIALMWVLVKEDFHFWLRALAEWASRSTHDDRKAGTSTLRAFHHYSWEYLAKSLDPKSDKQAIAQILLGHYKETFTSASVASYNVELAIEGIGALASTFSSLEGGEETGALFFKIIQQRLQSGFEQEEGPDADRNDELLPKYLESLSKICRAFKSVSSDQLTAIQQLGKLVIETYPNKLHYLKEQAEIAICKTIVNMSFCDLHSIDVFLYPIVYQGIIVTCGKTLIEDAKLEEELTGKEVITYQNYLPLWTNIIQKLSTENKFTLDLTPARRTSIVRKMYKNLIKTFYEILDKLDVGYQKLDSAETELKSDPSVSLKGTKPQDHNILCNISNLYMSLFEKLKGDILVRWLPDLTTTIINRSMKLPLVSAFYKLLSAILNLADRTNYFQDEKNESLGRYVVSYLEDVMIHCKQYKGDLQVSCLLAIIAVPVHLANPLLASIIPTLQMIFQLGQSNVPLAHKGMDTLERWLSTWQPNQLKPLLQQILPSFDPFLSSKGISTDVSESEEVQLSKRQQLRAKRVADSTELAKLQERMMKLLSQQDSVTLLSMLKKDYSAAIVWTPNTLLTIKIPFPDQRVNIALDSMLPRIVELALSSSDRQTKTAACEVLHACVIIFTGSGLTLVKTKEAELADLLRKLMPPLLRLGCGSDLTARQLFEPLVLQLVRWLTTPRMESGHLQSNEALEAIWDGLTNETDMALRDFSASCLVEFVKWSVKRTIRDDNLVNNINIKAVVKQITTYCTHPSLAKRIGAAIAFSHVARVLREHRTLVDRYWVELIYYMVRNLARGGEIHIHPATDGLKDSNVLKVIQKHEDVFNMESSGRRVPAEMQSADLRDLVRWLLHQCGSMTPVCAQKCRELVIKLSPLVQGLDNLNGLVDDYEMIAVCEGAGGGINAKLPIQPTLADSPRLLACLDCYSWCLCKGLVSPNVIAQIPRRVIPCIEYFINILEIKAPPPAVTSREGFAQIQSKCQLIIALFDLISMLDSAINTLPYTIWNSHFWSLVALCVFSPEKVGYDWRNSEQMTQLTLKLRSLLNTLRNHMSDLNELYNSLDKLVQLGCTNAVDRLILMYYGNLQLTVDHRQYINGLQILHQTELLQNISYGCTWNGNALLKGVFTSLFDSNGTILHPEPAVLKYTNQLLSFAVLLGAEVRETVSCVMNKEIAMDPQSPMASQITRGQHFLFVAEEILLNHMLQDAGLAVRTLLTQPSTPNVHVVLQLLNMCRHLKSKHYRDGREVVDTVFECWTSLVDWAATSLSHRALLLEILRAVVSTFPPSAVIGCLNREGSAVPSWLFHQISDPNVPLTNKVDLVELLPYAIVHGTTDHMLLSTMSSLETKFPVLTSELRPRSVERNSFIAVYKALLCTLETTGSIVVLRTITNAAIDSDHICEESIGIALKKFMKKHSHKRQLEALELIFDTFANDSKSTNLRSGIMKMFLLPMLQEASEQTVTSFYADKIQWILDILEEKFRNSQERKFERLVVVKTGCLQMVETLFNRVPKSDLDSADNIIVKSAKLPLAGKTLPQNFIAMSMDIRKLDCPFSNLHELFRKMQCANQNVFMTFFCNSEQTLTNASCFIFKEDKVPIWSKLVPIEPKFTFPIEFDHHPKLKKVLVQIRSKNRTEPSASQRTGPMAYMATQSLFTSSLNEDITRFDFSMYNVRGDSKPSVGESVNMSLVMEMDIINNHECMMTLSAAVKHLYETFPPIQEGQVPKLPLWMTYLQNSLTSRNQPSNCRAFLVKLILNNSIYFKPFASHWIGPILQTVVDKCFGDGVNYLIHDIVLMLSDWQSQAIPNNSSRERLLASEFLRLLVLYTPSERTGVFKYNVEVVKCVLTMWKPCLTVPYQELMDLITPQAPNTKVTEPGIRLADVFLVNGLLPFNETGKSIYYEHLLINLENPRREICKSTANIVGKILNIVSGGDQLTGVDLDFYNRVCDILNNKYGTTGMNNNLAEFVVCLHQIQDNYPPITVGFVSKCISKVQLRLHSLQCLLLETLITALDFDFRNDAFSLMRSELPKFLKDGSDPDMQLCSLKFIKKLVPTLSSGQINELFDSVVNLQNNRSTETRSVVYDIAAYIYDNYKEERDGVVRDLWRQANTVLVGGLTDPEENLQTKIYQFWTSEDRLASESKSRLADILGQLCSPKCEQDFLPVILNLLLQICEKTLEYNDNIFPHALATCAFQKYHVSGSWRLQHAANVPMFANTLASQLEFTSLSSYSDMPPLLRATQSQVPRYSSSLIVSAPSNADEELSLYSFGGMSGNSSILQNRSFNDGSGFGSALDATDSSQPSSSQQLKPIRFLKNKEQLSRMCAERNIVKVERLEKMQGEKLKRREGDVKLNREYRTGDLPDIEVPFSGVIKSFQSLAKKDHVTARQLLVTIYKGLVSVVNDADRRLPDALDKILQRSTHHDPSLMATILEMCMVKPQHCLTEASCISEVSKNSQQMAVGALLVEAKLLAEGDCPPPVKRSRSSSLSQNPDNWVNLAEIYHSMEEKDVVQGLFEDKISESCAHLVKEALVAEGHGHWSVALKKYKDSLSQRVGDSPGGPAENFLYEACFNCYGHLGCWRELNIALKDELENLDEVWEDSWTRDHMLPWLFKSEIHCAQTTSGLALSQDFQTALSCWLTNPSYSQHIKSRLGEYLSMVWVIKGETERGKLTSETSVREFLAQWQLLDPLSNNLRSHHLLNLFPLMDIHNFLSLSQRSDDSEKITTECLKNWNKSFPSMQDDLLTQQTRAVYRNIFGEKLKLLSPKPELRSKLVGSQINSNLDLLQCAIKQKNIHFALRFAEEFKHQLLEMTDRDKWDKLNKFHLCMSECALLKAQNMMDDRSDTEKFTTILEAFEEIGKIKLPVSTPIYSELQNEKANIYSSLMTFIQKAPTAVNGLDELKKIQFGNHINLDGDMVSQLKEKVISTLQEVVVVISPGISEAYLKIARFCHQIEDPVYENTLIQSLLRAMQYGSTEARRLFPCLLQLPLVNHRQLFIEESQNVPEWMFLSWVSQLLANLDTDLCVVLAPLLERLAVSYPEALRYPFHLSCDLYTYNCPATRQHVDKLKSLLALDSTTANLLQAIGCLCQPHHCFIYHLDRLRLALTQSEDAFVKVYEEMKTEAFPPDATNKIKGKAFKDVETFSKKLENIMNELESKKISRESCIKQIEQLRVEVNNDGGSKKMKDRRLARIELASFSPWLAHGYRGNVELPGQYTGESRPLPQHHVTISGFKSHVKSFHSLRAPIKITVIGNDAKDHSFLVKFGEDLRQDQRIQQLFALMNQLLRDNITTGRKQLSVVTYSVVPLNARLGIIEWLDKTEVLKDFIIQDKDLMQKAENAFNIYKTYYDKCFESKERFFRTPREQSVRLYQKVKNEIPMFALRDAVLRLSLNPEAFMHLRAEMLSSHAWLSACHWLLGIGDRHLENTLVCQTTGRFVGIDFGHAFGTATQFLPVPELIPMRLTPQILNLAAPFRETGLIKESMVHTLQVLREHDRHLLATMAVFILEPSLDWKRLAQKESEAIRGSEEKKFSREKIAMAQRKMEGIHPRLVTEEELANGHRRQPYYAAILAVLQDTSDSPWVRDMPAKGLNARQQVECIIAQATNEHILSKTYYGFASWM